MRMSGETSSMENSDGAAFPTAQLVAAMRSIDARSDDPHAIGSNVEGGGRDLAAKVFAGEVGFSFLREPMSVGLKKVRALEYDTERS